ncbi:MAG: ATP-binding cassette domain-containing protein [Clostridia bacterium]|nr:ATP-binding cassette domain-containing protein [Clostridia bacterium]
MTNMALLTLKDVGKIYVSDGNVAVGIRGVNLSFDRGEFVAVTGKSGSGKSTLLNVISGMDSYEEGELCIEGQSTSHYLQPEWEEYREKYISFIFQDYNIIDSFTVLQNVELALMHIEDTRERRARAMELIGRVGLSSHVRQKGSKLSGGQKQRTVIARALAKDSPIILADEPTGNLDSATSKEIIALLREVSKDKLVIVVTHNFEELSQVATRHIRIFDGAVESDHAVRPIEATSSASGSDPSPNGGKDLKKELIRQVKNGLTLGKTIFTAKPKLSVFLCLLMIVGTLGIFMMTTFCGSAMDLFDPHYMFNHIDGRVVVTTQSGKALTEDEVARLAGELGATDYLRFDVLLDEGNTIRIVLPTGNKDERDRSVRATYTYGKSYGDRIVGRYPQANDEVLLYLPIYLQPYVGKDTLLIDTVRAGSMDLRVVGVKYYYDNNKTAECLFTEEGFRTATAIYYLLNNSSNSLSLMLSPKNGMGSQRIEVGTVTPSFDMPADKIYIDSGVFHARVKELERRGTDYDVTLDFIANYRKYNYQYGDDFTAMTFQRTFTKADLTAQKPSYHASTQDSVMISDELLRQMAEEVLSDSYKQASLFFANDKEAHKAAQRLQDAGYIAVPSDTTYEPDAFSVILGLLGSLMMAFLWGLGIVFLAFFINLCSARTLGAFKGDMAIMRSMGISVKVIRIAMYVRMLISLIPAFILAALTAILIFTTPKLNEYFVYLYAWQYALICIGMLALTVRITYKQIRKLFGESVKKSLKGGAAE